MQNIQDLKEKIFFESKNIIGILDKISNVDELSSRQDLVEDLAGRISFLRLLEKNMEYFGGENISKSSEDNARFSSSSSHDGIQEEEAIFNNEFNEIDENENESPSFSNETAEEEAIFNNQLNEIVEGELHETMIHFAEESAGHAVQQELSVHNYDESPEHAENGSGTGDAEISQEKDEPQEHPDASEETDPGTPTEGETAFSSRLHEMDEFENEISDHQQETLNHFEEEERIQDHFEASIRENNESPAEETGNDIPSGQMMEHGEPATDTSGTENIVNDIRDKAAEGEKEKTVLAEISDRRKITDISHTPSPDNKIIKSDESFENLEAYHQERKIKLANIKGLKMVQSLFDDDHLEESRPTENPAPAGKREDNPGILKTNMPTHFMEAEKRKPEFKLDLNDRIAFSKTLFGGSQSELNEVVAHLNSFRTLEEAKEYLSDLYYAKKWSRVDEYAQRLWILVENKFL